MLRVPPDGTARLRRAALASKLWARHFADRGFRHLAAPMLGLLANPTDTGGRRHRPGSFPRAASSGDRSDERRAPMPGLRLRPRRLGPHHDELRLRQVLSWNKAVNVQWPDALGCTFS